MQIVSNLLLAKQQQANLLKNPFSQAANPNLLNQ
ncbi:hypothetical protein YERSI8AC_40127 [Enterobacterales bacterium 8AC]|nr:hypothetical protein YERSI8AC_40127 [Enterobacterales bacterium 8AC]